METVFIGKIKKVHGLKGEVVFELNEDVDLIEEETKFLLLAEKNAAPVPFFFTSLQSLGDHFLVKFENINSPAEAKSIVNRDVYAAAEAVAEFETDNSFEELVGYDVEDKNYGHAGKIESILQLPGQIIFSVKHISGKEILMPAIEDFILGVDDEKRRLLYEAPDGLIELYLNPGKPEEEDEQ